MSLRLVGVILLLALTHGLSVALGYFLEHRKQSKVVLVVNGDMVTRRDLDRALSVFRDEATQQIAAQHIVEQACKRQNISVNDKDLNLKSLEGVDDELRAGKTDLIRTEALFRKLVLSDFSEADRHRVYDDFKPELQQYHLSCFRVIDGVDIRRFKEDLARKGSTFETLAKAYQRSADSFVLPDALILERIRLMFGQSGCHQIRAMKPGEILGPIPSAFGMIVLKLERVDDSYESLKPSIEELLHKSRVRFYQYHLGIGSAVTSFLPVEKAERPKDKQTPDFRLPQPSVSATPNLQPLPLPKDSGTAAPGLKPPTTATPVPSFLPKPKDGAAPVPELPPVRTTASPAPGPS